MDAKNNKQPSVITQLKEYAETHIKLAKYEAIDKSSSIIGELIADMVQVICILLITVFASLTLAFYLASILDSLWAGFGLVLLMYLLIFFFVRMFKKKIEKPIINAVVHKFFKHI